jgi:hypothetical protein
MEIEFSQVWQEKPLQRRILKLEVVEGEFLADSHLSCLSGDKGMAAKSFVSAYVAVSC